MRWFVEVSRSGQSTRQERYCVEAAHWRAALQQPGPAGDAAPLSAGLAVDVSEAGYRVIDPTTRIRYTVVRAPDDTPLGRAGDAPAVAEHGAADGTAGPTEPASIADTERMPPPTDPQTLPAEGDERGDDADTVRDLSGASPQPPSVRPPAATPMAGEASFRAAPSSSTQPSLVAPRQPDSWLIHRREEDPSPPTPITYREYAYAVDPGTTHESAETLLWVRFKEVCSTIAEYPPGKFVQLAVFDHAFQGRPARPPLATLAWKDWRGDPVVAFPAHPGVARRGQAPGPVSQPPPGFGGQVWRRKADEVIGELFESMADLPHQADAASSAAVTLQALQRCLPCAGVLIHFFDLSTSEFVVTCASGPQASATLSLRTSRGEPPFAALDQDGTTRCFDAVHDPGYVDARRWQALGVRPTFTLGGLLLHQRRIVGAIELANPADGAPFTPNEAQVLGYVCDRLGEFLGGKPLEFGVVVISDG
jgi:hypothetical protein